MKPESTGARLQAVLEELMAREPIFHRPALGTSRQAFESMTDPDFWEVGASGHCYSRQYVIDTLVERHASPHEDVWETSEFHCRELAPDIYLLTYRLVQGASRITRRCTIWRKDQGEWKIVYHQGTIVST